MFKIIHLLLALVLAAPAAAAPQPELWARWQQHDAGSDITIDHGGWDDFLAAYRREKDGIALIDYAGVSADDREQLQDYLQRLADSDVDSLDRDEQRAYWINLYNALTVETILQNYPVDSIRDIKSSLFSPGPWDLPLITVMGEDITLNDIEHRILRPIWPDPRLHYAVNCASIGCPNLAPVAFTAGNSETLLDEGARQYINHPRGVSVQDGRITASSIYDWFNIDFGDGSDGAIIKHLQEYAKPALRAQLDTIEDIGDYDYDWSLNQP